MKSIIRFHFPKTNDRKTTFSTAISVFVCTTFETVVRSWEVIFYKSSRHRRCSLKKSQYSQGTTCIGGSSRHWLVWAFSLVGCDLSVTRLQSFVTLCSCLSHACSRLWLVCSCLSLVCSRLWLVCSRLWFACDSLVVLGMSEWEDVH